MFYTSPWPLILTATVIGALIAYAVHEAMKGN